MKPKGNCGLNRYLRKFDDYMEMFIIGLMLETPFLYLKEVCAKVNYFPPSTFTPIGSNIMSHIFLNTDSEDMEG